MGGAGKQPRGCSDVSVVGDIGINVTSFLSPDNAEIIHSNNSFEKSFIHKLIPHVTLYTVNSLYSIA